MIAAGTQQAPDFESSEIPDVKLSAVYSYIDKEMKLEASASAISGVVAAWLVKGVILDPNVLWHFAPSGRDFLWFVSGALTFAAVFFFLQRSRLANVYWLLALRGALPSARQWTQPELVSRLNHVRWWWPYYLARGLVTLAFISLIAAFYGFKQ